MSFIKSLKKNIKFILVGLMILLSLTVIVLCTVYAVSRNNDTAKVNAINNSSVVEIQSNGEEPQIPVEDVKPLNLNLPSDLRAFYLSPKTDFYNNVNDSEQVISNKIKSVVDKTKALGFNSLVVDTKLDNTFIYDSDYADHTKVDALKMIQEQAQDAGLSVYAVYYVNSALQKESSDTKTYLNFDKINALSDFVKNYNLDGVLLDDYYSQKNADTYSGYMTFGGNIGYEQWLTQNTSYLISSAINAAHDVSNTTAVGLLLDPVWATKTQNKNGIDVKSNFSALKNGFADTKQMLEKKLADFVAVKSLFAIDDPSQPFEKVVKWWGAVSSKSQTPLYVVHDGTKVCTANKGWAGYDQLTRQVASGLKTKGY
ncbi:MAG: N-acetylmuramoyl-L-alanine amidase, partial [Oscillospiraceae bacterium]|nr:N-acetylmuramoyl-L-alanine amidase [Oscillospiraceae bacterium]